MSMPSSQRRLMLPPEPLTSPLAWMRWQVSRKSCIEPVWFIKVASFFFGALLYYKRRATREYRTEKAQDRAGRETRQ